MTIHIGNVAVGTAYSALPSEVCPPVDVDVFLTNVSNRSAVCWATINKAGQIFVNSRETSTGGCFGVVTYCV